MKSLAVSLIAITLSLATISCRCADEAVDVAHEEFGPRAALKKYEWFKDAAAALDAKTADIKIYEVRVQQLQEQYGEKPRSEWAREDREQYRLMTTLFTAIGFAET